MDRNIPPMEGDVMLVLSRKIGEGVVITVPPSTETRTIRVSLADILGRRGSFGVEAERDIRIHRDELLPEADRSRRTA